MSIAQRLLVKNNIDSLGDNINKLSQIFYRELFHIEIGLKEIFPGNVVFLNRKFANMLGTFKNMEHLEKISASIEKMGERHSQNYAVQLEHFEPIEQALMLALHEYFTDEFTLELETAWHSVFQEVTDIMKQAMGQVAHQPKAERLHDMLSYDTQLLDEVQGTEGVRKVHQRFYDVLFAEPWLGKFFYGKAKDVLVDKQTQFMVAAFGGENLYKGDTPAFVHMHMYVTDEMSDLRQQVLRQAILAEGHSDSIADRWLKVDDSFRASIVKNSVDECVLKCVGQMPVVAKKPENY
ncbi:MAG: hypothetical protein methR_P0774 [Methyloprofundus sp.]|nr:MAG: hypothetical protein methR_P0774 [Methyloprofundus sp.]